MNNPHYSKAVKKAVNVTVNKELLELAKEMKINLSATLEQALVKAIQEERSKQWLAVNESAIEEYNQKVDENGVFSDGLRKF
ncbi:MAG: type II toxin-antitoxin system CcdA family antitoxin [Gammaproteobacteria bacterium]|nr:type II toxin-antitoxin system CcdA family antitoxin [Gammaproteobacteria bacterium]